MKVELLQHTPEPEKLIEQSGRVCYQSSNNDGNLEKREKFIKAIVRNEHLSVLEHASASFKITGVSRALTHELVRHRLFSFSQRSQRYCLEDNFGYIIPESIMNNSTLREEYEGVVSCIEHFYQRMIDNKIPREDARYILPNAVETQIVVSGNFREWRHFLNLRLSKRAQWEIRNLATEILSQLYKIAPNVFQDISDREMEKEKEKEKESV